MVTATEPTAILESALEFGLTRDEILDLVGPMLDRLPVEAKTCCGDELARALAARLIEKERVGVHDFRKASPDELIQ
jgi:hypothetical protein